MLTEEMIEIAAEMLLGELKTHGTGDEQIYQPFENSDPYRVSYRAITIMMTIYRNGLFDGELPSLEEAIMIAKKSHTYFDHVIFSDEEEAARFGVTYRFIRDAWE